MLIKVFTGVVFLLDLYKAFETADKLILLWKLKNYFEIRGSD